MSKNAYEILGVDENATKAEIDEAYYALRTKYRNEMYQEGALGKAAARKLTEVEQAYQDICSNRTAPQPDPIVMEGESTASADDGGTESSAAVGKHSPAFAAVEQAIKAKDFRLAQEALDNVSVRDAEWHYFQAVIYYNKGWMSEARNQMEMACNMDAANLHYKDVLGKLNAAIDNAATAGGKGYNPQTQTAQAHNDGYRRSYAEQDARQSEDMCCRWCQTMICINCLCDCCCRG